MFGRYLEWISPRRASSSTRSQYGGSGPLLRVACSCSPTTAVPPSRRQATARFAAVVSPRLAFKISGDWLQGHDWEYRDSAEVSNRSKAIQQGADPDTLLIGLRDFRLRRAAGEARLDWRPDNATTVIASVGAAEAIRVIDVTGQVGGLQNRNWRYSFAQAKLHRGRLFANVTYNLNDAGDTYQLRTGLPLVDNSRQTTAQLQHGADAGRVALLYGLDGRWTDPRTGGTIHGRNEDDDLVAEAGGYVQARAVTSPRLDLVAAVRVDRNNRLNDLVVSPRAAAVFKPAPGHALRLTYNRAFSAPDASALFLDIMLAPGLPYNVRQVAIPRDGFSFRRDCGGICMRSPYNPRGQQEYLLADATLLWDTIRARFALSDVPPPNASQVATQLAALNPANLRSYLPLAPAEILDVAPPRRAIFQTVELGYDGTLAGRVLIAVDAYVNEVKDPMGPRVTATPNVFYDSTTLAAYLSSFRRDSAAQLAGKIAKIPVGTISPQEATDPIDILLVQSQGGAYTLWGADASLTAAIASRIELTGTYSWVSRNIVPGIPTAGTIVLSVPRTKGAVTVRYRDEQTRLTAALEARAVGGFLARSGFIRGEIEPYAVLDAHVGYRLPPTARITLSVDAYNLLDHRHREFAGAPEIGRLVVSRVQVRL